MYDIGVKAPRLEEELGPSTGVSEANGQSI